MAKTAPKPPSEAEVREKLPQLLRKQLIFAKPDGRLYQRATPALYRPMSDEELLAHLGATKVLNRMPSEEALQLYLAEHAPR